VLTPLKPRKYQLESIARAQGQNLLVADDCGLGKTLTAIEAARLLMAHPGPNKTLIVCPLKVREQWIEQIQNQDDQPIYALNSMEVNLRGVSGWFIIHYDALDKASYLTKYFWSVLIADEAHRLRNRNNRWTKAIKRITSARVIALTATPMDRLPSEYWSLLDFLSVPRLPKFNGFKAKYENWNMKARYPIYIGPKNIDKLQSLLGGVMVKHTKAGVVPELPPHIIIPTSVEMSVTQTEAFNQIDFAEDIIVPVTGIDDLIIQNALVKLVRLQQVGTDPSLLDIEAPSGKIEWLDEFLEDHPTQKVVVFTKWRHTALCLAQRYSSALVIGGREPEGLEDFKQGDQKVLVGTIAGMGLGLDLPMATYSVFLDMEWSTLQMQQAYDRIHRMNITEPKVTYLLMANRVDTLIYKAVLHKWSEIELITAFLQGPCNT